jgi:3-hydroxybutyryl-CoA dehydrogenase
MITKIAVLGAGQMGSGIAQVSAVSGKDVLLYDIKEEFIKRGIKNIQSSLDRFVQKGKLSAADKDTAINRITLTTNFSDIAAAEFVIEAIPEDPVIKLDTFKRLDALLKQDVILASNTSSISITRIAGMTGRPDKVIGMHFMNPVPVMKLVEVVKGIATSEETLNTTLELAKQLGKTTVVSKDSAGFIVNRILAPWINEAVYALMEGIATPGDIDTAMKLGTNVPMGPLELADFIGLDTMLAILEVLHNDLGDPKYRPCPLLRKYVEAGMVGKKKGRGFYKY